MSKQRFTLGIDPGKKGALSLIQNDELVEVWDFPCTPKLNGKGEEINAVLLHMLMKEIVGFPKSYDEYEIIAHIETVNAMPGQGVTSCFSFGKSVGLAHMACVCHDIPVVAIRPQQWKKHFGLLKREKDAARALVLSKFPERTDLFKRKKDCDRADATLIALFPTE